MAKVIVYEDNFSDWHRRYGPVSKDHDLHLVAVAIPHLKSEIEFLRSEDSQWLKEEQGYNLNPDNVQEFRNPHVPEKADIYFVDGLDGFCFEIMDLLPKDRTFLYTEDSRVQDAARQQGREAQILKESPKDLVSRLTQ